MTNDIEFSRTGRLYVSSVVLAGFAVVAYSTADLLLHPFPKQWLVLAALTLLTGSFSVKIPSLSARFSVSEAFVFACVLLFGPSAAIALVALDSLVMSVWSKRNRRSRLRWLFNFSSGALAIAGAAHLFFLLTKTNPTNFAELLPLEKHLWHLFALAAAYFVLNSWFVTFALSFERKASPIDIWLHNFPWLSLNYFGGVSVSALLVSYTRSVDINAIAIILPLLLITYVTHRTSLGRIDDAKRHVDQVNGLYMSTIEALAMAIDAKDQITHGHIRRVQAYAIELAKRLGSTDIQQIRALETAALLHDMGKLAIPEHILNKPGRLSTAEFNQMKRHAEIGADLLSSIKFPYPVVPIVRHHHEHWDGSGYPSGISGTDIPIGARILSVVDCFDALTSDRPYRPRLSPSDAFSIIKERRGSMYDPLVVDTFIRVYPEIFPIANQADEEARQFQDAIDFNAVSPTRVSPLWTIRATTSESALLVECSKSVRGTQSPTEAYSCACEYLRQLLPATVFAQFTYQQETDLIICDFTEGDPQRILNGLSIRLGERISGWVGANLRTSVNSDPSLDLIRMSDQFAPQLKSTLSSPIVSNDRLVGVLSAYAPTTDAFTDNHIYIFEHVIEILAEHHKRLTPTRSASLIKFKPN